MTPTRVRLGEIENDCERRRTNCLIRLKRSLACLPEASNTKPRSIDKLQTGHKTEVRLISKCRPEKSRYLLSAFLAVNKGMENISNVESGSDGSCFGQFTSQSILHPHYTYRFKGG